MYHRLLKPPTSNHSFFLFGPRGTGKTLWVKTHFPNALYFDLLQSHLYNQLLADPGQLEQMIPKGFTDWVILDEIQKVPALLNEVHRLIEEKGYKFILTSSSARSLRRQGANLLGGRAGIEHMFPLTAAELGQDFDLKEALVGGLLPTIWNTDIDPQSYLEGYIEAYLQQEVAQEAMVRRLGDFARFLKIASLSQGQPVNHSNIAREVALSRDRVAGYFQILEDLLIGIHLPPFTRRADRRLVTHPKFYFFDAGLFQALRPRGPLDSSSEIEGAALETLVLENISAVNTSLKLGYDISYWRTSTGLEIDFILYGPKGLHAIEVKRSKTIGPRDRSALTAFLKDFPEAKGWIIYGGEQPLYFDNVTAIPFGQFLVELPNFLK